MLRVQEDIFVYFLDLLFEGYYNALIRESFERKATSVPGCVLEITTV